MSSGNKFERTLSSRSVSAQAYFDVIDAAIELRIVDLNVLQRATDYEMLKALQRTRISETDLLRLWRCIDQNTRVTAYGLLIGQRIAPATKGILASWVSQCETLGEALNVFIRHIRLMSDIEKFECRRVNDGIEIEHCLSGLQGYPDAFLERSLSALVAWAGHLSQTRIRPIEAHFRWQRPPHWKDYLPLFGDHLNFGTEKNILRLDSALLDRPLTSANPFLKTKLREQALDTLSALDASTPLWQQVSNEIARHIDDPNLSIISVCEKFGVTRQTLYRQLKSEGHTFSGLHDALRKVRAEHLADTQLTMETIADLLGFRDASACHKAYRRWFKMTFTHYRQQKKTQRSF
ncbi:MAG: AraC family transcriptional regulator ligand-binding domain-containing protein [Hahellaceae bacterium]|nr:AraC family transcriptional regulator ligand-binding domain-containing protein [Hahellaceae bacterium]